MDIKKEGEVVFGSLMVWQASQVRCSRSHKAYA